MTLRHIVLLTIDPNAGLDLDALVDQMRSMGDAVPSVRSLEVLVDIGLDDDTADLAVLATFDDPAGFAAYQTHPLHREVVDALHPHMISRVAIQAEV